MREDHFSPEVQDSTEQNSKHLSENHTQKNINRDCLKKFQQSQLRIAPMVLFLLQEYLANFKMRNPEFGVYLENVYLRSFLEFILDFLSM